MPLYIVASLLMIFEKKFYHGGELFLSNELKLRVILIKITLGYSYTS